MHEKDDGSEDYEVAAKIAEENFNKKFPKVIH